MTAPPNGWIFTLMGVMLISGTANTLLMKLQVRTRVSPGQGKEPVGFGHPVTQTLFMLFGETILLFVYYFKQRSPEEKVRANNFPKAVMAIPAAFDLIASTLVHASYIFIPASVVQMCRSANMLFVCALSIVWLKRRQHTFHFVGIGSVFLGIVLVAMAAHLSLEEDVEGGVKSGSRTFIGIVLCLGAQLFHAAQNCIEEKVLSDYRIPAQQAVGLEGVFGSLIVIVVLLIMNPLHGENTIAALYQMNHSGALTAAVICGILSTALFNWSGMSITEQSSCIARATIDGARTMFVWIIELSLRWHNFIWLQLLGFIFVALGTCIYNRIIELDFIFDYPGHGEENKLNNELQKKDSENVAH